MRLRASTFEWKNREALRRDITPRITAKVTAFVIYSGVTFNSTCPNTFQRA